MYTHAHEPSTATKMYQIFGEARGACRGEAQRARVGLALRSCGGIRRTIEKMEVYCSRVVVEGGRGEDTYLTFIIVDIMVDGVVVVLTTRS